MDEYIAYMYVHVPQGGLVPSESRRGNLISWNLGYRAYGAEAPFSARVAVALNHGATALSQEASLFNCIDSMAFKLGIGRC